MISLCLLIIQKVLFINQSARLWFVNSEFIYFFMKVIAVSCKFILNLFGYDVSVYYSHHFSVDHGLFVIHIPPDNGMYIGIQCLALGICSVFATLIASFHGKTLTKIWFITAGVLLIQIINILRFCYLVVASKSLSEIEGRESLKMTGKLIENHHNIFNLIVYGVILILFMVYVKYFSVFKKREKSD